MDEGTRKLIEEIDNRLSNRYMVYEQVGNSLTVKTSQLQSIPKRQKIDIFLLCFET